MQLVKEMITLLDCPYFKKHKLIAIKLIKQLPLDADPPQKNSNFTGNLVGNLVSNRVGETAIYFIIEEVKETVLSFLKGEPLFFFFFFLVILMMKLIFLLNYY